MRLQDLPDLSQPPGRLVPAAGLHKFYRHEGRHRITERGGVDVRAEPGDHAAGLHLVDPGLHGAPRHPKPPGCLEDPDPRLSSQQLDQTSVQLVDHPCAFRCILFKVCPVRTPLAMQSA